MTPRGALCYPWCHRHTDARLTSGRHFPQHEAGRAKTIKIFPFQTFPETLDLKRVYDFRSVSRKGRPAAAQASFYTSGGWVTMTGHRPVSLCLQYTTL